MSGLESKTRFTANRSGDRSRAHSNSGAWARNWSPAFFSVSCTAYQFQVLDAGGHVMQGLDAQLDVDHGVVIRGILWASLQIS